MSRNLNAFDLNPVSGGSIQAMLARNIGLQGGGRSQNGQ